MSLVFQSMRDFCYSYKVIKCLEQTWKRKKVSPYKNHREDRYLKGTNFWLDFWVWAINLNISISLVCSTYIDSKCQSENEIKWKENILHQVSRTKHNLHFSLIFVLKLITTVFSV